MFILSSTSCSSPEYSWNIAAWALNINNQSIKIPKTSTNPKHPSKPWFTDECDKAIGDRKKAHRQFNKRPTSDNLENFRIFRAKARRTCKQARRTSWRNFVSGLKSNKPMNKVWNFIQKIKGKNSKSSVKHLKTGDRTLTSERYRWQTRSNFC